MALPIVRVIVFLVVAVATGAAIVVAAGRAAATRRALTGHAGLSVSAKAHRLARSVR